MRRSNLLKLSLSVHLVALALSSFLLQGRAAEPPLALELWSGTAPEETTALGPERIRPSPALERRQVEVTNSTRLITSVSKPSLTLQFPEPTARNGAVVLIFPGGGYWDLYWELEGEEVAAWLNSMGVTGVLVKYRVPRRPGEPEREPARRPLQDAQRAIRIVRSRAAEWGLDPNRIGVIGFSAGGHLAVSCATKFNTQTYEARDAMDSVDCRPNFAIAAYSGYLKAKDANEVASGLTVPRGTPPMFLVHGDDDIISSPEHSVLFYLALKRAGVSAELHVYANTTHDFAVRPSERPHGQWTDACFRWMKNLGLLTPNDPSKPVKGDGVKK